MIYKQKKAKNTRELRLPAATTPPAITPSFILLKDTKNPNEGSIHRGEQRTAMFPGI